MYISDLELHGFKSFALKTHIKFDSGITAIVGPNGCGKSNIVDALRWVLGEQRPTLLRSSAMSNVIFNGTAQKKALGLAEVALTFVNNKGLLPTEYSELTITRRLYRSGDSEYMINNTTCRLKDIMELFMDTGMSSDAYSVIELKMVEEILNDKNNDRRRLFEEAAGVTRYKEKRRHTFRKLDETQKDLQRLEDILVEVRKKTNSLEKQAEKAAKAKTYETELITLDKAYNRFEYNKIREELEPLNERISNAEKEKSEITSTLEKIENSEENAQTELISRERNQAEAQRRVTQLLSSIRDMETNLKITREKINNESSVIGQYENDIKQGQKDVEDLEAIRSDGIEKIESFSGEIEQSEKSLEEAKKRFTELQQQYTRLRHELYELEISIGNNNQKQSEYQSRRIKLESKLENSEDDQERIDRDITDFEKEIENASQELDGHKKRFEELESELVSLEEHRDKVHRKKDELDQKREEIREVIRTQKSNKDSLNSEIELLEQISKSNDDLPGSIHYLLKNHADSFSYIKTVGDALQTKEVYAPALEAALGNAVHFLIVDSMDEAKKASEILKENKKGQATFIPLSELKKFYPVISYSIADHVDCEPKAKPAMQLLLGQVLLAENIDTATGLLAKNGSSAVTPEGELLTSNGLFRSGSKNKQTGMRLGLKDKLNKLHKKYASVETKLADSEQKLNEIESEYENANTGLVHKQVREKQQEIRKVEQLISRYQSSIQVYQKNINDLKNRRNTLSSSLSEAQDELETLKPEQKNFQKKSEELHHRQKEKKEVLQKLEDERAIAQNRFNDAQLKHQDVKNKADNLQRDINRAESGIQNIKQRLTSRHKLMEESRQRIIECKEHIELTEKKLEEKRKEKQTADKKLKAAEEACAEQRGKIREFDQNLKELRNRKEVNNDLLHHLQMAKEKFELKAQSLSDHIWETYGILMDQLTETLPGKLEPEQAKERISWLRQKINQIGDVNPLAIEEFEEEKKRLDFYEEQIQDLQQAEKELRETIDEINRTATERFNTTFEQIRLNFIKAFHTLFNEDDFCDLTLEENEEDPLEAKIEIKANPRGKRPSGINQLSGGEKTLTAIALLFGIYLVKPSPFCVLDEVDAPLDDANIERFSDMIKSFSDETQFIIITHNKKTMSKADMMYGITMPDTGVSRLVGVKLDEVAEV